MRPLTILAALVAVGLGAVLAATAGPDEPLPWTDARTRLETALSVRDLDEALAQYRDALSDPSSCVDLGFTVSRYVRGVGGRFPDQVQWFGRQEPHYYLCGGPGKVAVGFGLGIGQAVYHGPGIAGPAGWARLAGDPVDPALVEALDEHAAPVVMGLAERWEDLRDVHVDPEPLFWSRFKRYGLIGWAGLGASFDAWYVVPDGMDLRADCDAVHRIRSRTLDDRDEVVVACFRQGDPTANGSVLVRILAWTDPRHLTFVSDLDLESVDRAMVRKRAEGLFLTLTPGARSFLGDAPAPTAGPTTPGWPRGD